MKCKVAYSCCIESRWSKAQLLQIERADVTSVTQYYLSYRRASVFVCAYVALALFSIFFVEAQQTKLPWQILLPKYHHTSYAIVHFNIKYKYAAHHSSENGFHKGSCSSRTAGIFIYRLNIKCIHRSHHKHFPQFYIIVKRNKKRRRPPSTSAKSRICPTHERCHPAK